MFETFKTYAVYGSRYCGIEHTNKNGETTVHITLLKKTNKSVDIEKHYTTSSTGELTKVLRKKQHASLIINDEQILTKVVNSTQQDDLKLVYQAFSNIDISKFYYEIISQGDQAFVTICRRSYVDNLIKSYQKQGVLVLDFSLGNSSLANVVSYVEDDMLLTSNATIHLNKGLITDIDMKPSIESEAYHINGLRITNDYFLSFCAGLNTILNNYHPKTNYKDESHVLFKGFKEVRFFSQFFKLGLVFLFAVLLVNTLIFNHYYNKVNTLNETSLINQAAKDKIVTLSKTVGKLQKTADDILKSTASKSSYYMNAIINSLPESILLSGIQYQPLEKKPKPNKPIQVKRNTIVISGDSNDSDQYSNWISKLETMDWVKGVEVMEYKDIKLGASHFSIKINMKNDQSD